MIIVMFENEESVVPLHFDLRMNSDKPIIVVGAGLAGLSVAARLIERNKRVILFDNSINYSSIIAAGMINPLVFRRMNKSWRADECVEEIQSFYTGLEQKTESSFFHPITIRRMFSNEHERDLWLQRQSTPEYNAFMTKTTEEDDKFSGAINNFGSGRVKQAAYVDTSVFLSKVKEYVSKHGEVVSKAFDYSQLRKEEYRGLEFEKLIFCEGYLGKENPFFGYLPIQQTKGETLDITAQTVPENESVNRKCFILPLGNKKFRVGSTYVWHCDDTSITEEGREAILEKVAYLTNEKVEVVDQKAGVRPTSPDRRPMIGKHPEHDNLYVFNALGTKGYLIAPLMSREFVDHLLDGVDLDPEVTIDRFEKRYQRSINQKNDTPEDIS